MAYPVSGSEHPPVEDDPLRILQVFERLEVGPVTLSPRKLTAPYRLIGPEGERSIDLIYRYEEDVFEDDLTGQNLAGMVAAQVALNYGLFCRTMVFHGVFDNADRRFIRDMTENTSREIYVKKFLEPNPFLKGPAGQLSIRRLDRYTRSAIEFSEPPATGQRPHWLLWATDRNRHAVLSSGGKDSLLTYGLLNELGNEVYPLFVNESGRHWWTALNAYQHFKTNVPRTGRIWTNSDQVFSWFLRQMPFIRRDFHSVRSDEYPIRLWTVAVFLFGALPLVRRHGIGRILIGDEYDTTVRKSFQGIAHYDGLFDQSRYFDNTLSRYYMRKGWSISQFSILRPLSEILIQKILHERYPDLQAQQISCHAAHKQDDRIRPCGRCEKCRRIVGMLKAIDGDPTVCGYTPQQIDDCLSELEDKGVHQEAPAVQHLLFALRQKNLLRRPGKPGQTTAERSEVLKIRLDPERSPLSGIPMDLRKPLIDIYSRHARGTVARRGRHWTEISARRLPDIDKPYAFEMESPPPGPPGTDGDAGDRTHIWGELTWPEAKRRFTEVDIALLPVGSIEQHGPHLPLDTDAFDADHLARRVAEACSPPRPLILPMISYGVSYEHDEFRGTISIRNDTLSRLVYDIGMAVAGNGINKLVVINGHGGNNPALNHAAQMINRDAKIFVCIDSGETSDVDIYGMIDTPNDVHAGEIETSTALAVRPGLVRMDRIEKYVPEFTSRYLNFTSKRNVSWYAYTQNVSRSGVLGDPSKASAAKGKKIWQIMIAHLVSLVEDLKGMTLDEIHNRKF